MMVSTVEQRPINDTLANACNTFYRLDYISAGSHVMRRQRMVVLGIAQRERGREAERGREMERNIYIYIYT